MAKKNNVVEKTNSLVLFSEVLLLAIIVETMGYNGEDTNPSPN